MLITLRIKTDSIENLHIISRYSDRALSKAESSGINDFTSKNISNWKFHLDTILNILQSNKDPLQEFTVYSFSEEVLNTLFNAFDYILTSRETLKIFDDDNVEGFLDIYHTLSNLKASLILIER